MNPAVLALFLINFVLIGLLPLTFFKRDGRLNLMWWLTAAPYVLSSASLVASAAGRLPPLIDIAAPVGPVLALLSVPFAVGSVSLIAYTLGSHRVQIALWHQLNDAPRQIVTHGAYKRIRHPFYSAFLLALLGAALFCPQAGTLGAFAYALVIMNHTAASEERRLAASEFGAEYREYMRRTGRFLPRLGGEGT